ncbi:hypothetical protein DVH05_027696 [Phytophthora capsici]|nr:hypothetical protein DVH05_027696 [Phytophthora capsici]
MHVAATEHGLEVLPAISIHERWNTFSALDIKESLASASDALQPVVQMSKLRLPKVRLPYESEQETATASPGVKQVVYVRLRRRERANQVVLSSGEKYSYAKAMLEPLLEHLSNLPSTDFYRELNAWKETVEVGLKEVSGEGERANDEDDEFATDISSSLEPADAMETAKLMEVLEGANTEDTTECGTDDDEVPATQVNQQPPSSDSEQTGRKDKSSKRNKFDSANSSSLKAAPVRQVDIINVPKPKRRGRPRTTAKQLTQTKLQPRLAIHKYPTGLTVSLDHLLVWARNTPNLKYVMEILEMYPVQLEDAYLRARTIECRWEAMKPATYMHKFTIPMDLMRSMQAAIITARKEQRRPDKLDDRVKSQGFVLDLVASIDPKLWKFSR